MAGSSGLAVAGDDDITVWAHNLGGVLVTTDREYSQRKARNVIGKHIWLRCPDPEAAQVLELHLNEVLDLVRSAEHVLVRVGRNEMFVYYRWD